MATTVIQVPAEGTTEISRAESLVARARGGERLPTDERRIALAHMMANDASLSNVELGKILGVGEAMIRKDKIVIREEMSEEVSKEDVGLVITDLIRRHERFVVDMEKSLKALKPGTKLYLDYQVALKKAQHDHVAKLQDLGFYPKNLGVLQKQQWIFKATVGKDGNVDTQPLAATDKKTIDAAKITYLPKPTDDPAEEALRDSLREEFAQTAHDRPKALPAPKAEAEAEDDGSYDADGA